MPVNLKGRSFLTLKDFTPDEIRYMLNLAADLKAKKRAGIRGNLLAGKNIVLLFEKTSTRTRCAFEVAAYDEGANVTFLDSKSSQMGKKETMVDTAKVLGRFYDGIEYRGYDQKVVEGLAANAGVPVWNGLTNEAHPTQILADFLTMREHFGKLAGLNFVYMGDARYNMGNSLMVGCAKMGVNFTACAPRAYFPEEKLIEQCRGFAAESGAQLRFLEDPMEATRGADVIYTDVWVSMGEPDEVWAERIKLLEPYRVTEEVMAMASKDAIFLHCLPSFHDTNTTTGADIAERFGVTEMEVTDGVFESKQSKVFDEAENRMHTIKAVMYATLS